MAWAFVCPRWCQKSSKIWDPVTVFKGSSVAKRRIALEAELVGGIKTFSENVQVHDILVEIKKKGKICPAIVHGRTYKPFLPPIGNQFTSTHI